MTEAEEERVIEQIGDIAVHECRQSLVALTVEGREDEYQHTEHHTAQRPPAILRLHALDKGSDFRVHRREVIRHEAAAYAQQHIKRDLVYDEYVRRTQRD